MMRAGPWFAAVVATLVLVAPAGASHIQCGDVITQDTRLDSDLNCNFAEGEGTAITIAADRVTLDLASHSITGPPVFNDAAGIAASGVAAVVVRNGTVRDFSIDVRLDNVADTRVRQLRSATIVVGGDRNVVRDNVDASGISVQGNQNLVAGNQVASPFAADDRRWLAVSGGDNTVTDNVVTNVGPSGAHLTAFGILMRLHGGLVARNVVRAASAWSPAPDVFVTGMDISGDAAAIRRNSAFGHVDGFAVRAPVEFTGNEASGNLDDGIDVGVSGATLTRNTANDNGDLGIQAVPATIDGGGNRARGNGNPAQCTGVACR